MSPFNVDDPALIFPGDLVVKRTGCVGMLWTTPIGVEMPIEDRGRNVDQPTTCLVIGFFGEDAFVITSTGEQGYIRRVALKPIVPR